MTNKQRHFNNKVYILTKYPEISKEPEGVFVKHGEIVMVSLNRECLIQKIKNDPHPHPNYIIEEKELVA